MTKKLLLAESATNAEALRLNAEFRRYGQVRIGGPKDAHTVWLFPQNEIPEDLLPRPAVLCGLCDLTSRTGVHCDGSYEHCEAARLGALLRGTGAEGQGS